MGASQPEYVLYDYRPNHHAHVEAYASLIARSIRMHYKPEVPLSFSQYTTAKSSQRIRVASFTQRLSGESLFLKGLENPYRESWFDGVYLIITARIYNLKLRKHLHLYNGIRRPLITNTLIVNNLY